MRRFTCLLTVAISLVAAAPAAATPEWGIVPQDGTLPAGTDLDLMPGGGITGLRAMLSWSQVERNRGEYDWDGPDELVRETTSRGIQPFFFLYGTPNWAAAVDNRRCTATVPCSVYPPRTEETRQAFGQFAAAAAARYGPGGTFWTPGIDPTDPPTEDPTIPPPLPTEPPCGCTEPHPITVWQVWNEQNSPKYFAPKVDAGAYALLLQGAATGIRSVDPQAEIVTGGMWGPSSAKHVVTPTAKYLKQLYALDSDDDFDAVAIHPYANNAKQSVDQLKEVRRVMNRAGDKQAGIWITEIGWAAGGPRNNPYVKGLTGQARILSQALSAYKRKSRILKLRGVFWYSWRDKDGGDLICEWCGYAGLRDKKGEAKPAWRAFVRVARG